MSTSVINSYNGTGLTLGAYINSILTQNQEIGGVAGPSCPHKNFWESMSYTEFTTGNVPGVNFGPNPPYPVIVQWNGASSNIVLALQGKGPLFDPNNGAFGEMPANANPPSMPYFTADQVKPIADWIDAKCPNAGGS
ncbi:MAG: hypothetical protein ACJ8AI_13980 [Rhodopila sp.]|jgi:hypothetical protein